MNQKKEATYGHVLKFTGVFTGVQGIKLLASLIRNMLSSKLLGTIGFGLIGIYSNITEFVTSCTNCGIPINTTRQSSKLYEEGDEQALAAFACTVRTWCVWTAAMALFFIVLLSPILSYFFFDKRWDCWWEVVTLAPIPMLLLVTEGECSLLKGIRRLKWVASIETLTAITTLLTTIPLYYFMGLRGIVLALILSTLCGLLLHLHYSTRALPYRIRPFSMEVLRRGWPMVRQGLPYVVAGIATSGYTMLVPIIITSSGTVSDVGLYRAAFTLMAGYAGMAFVALETDYYPRLSAAVYEEGRMNECINQQVRVCVMIITPLLILLSLCMPWVIRILYTPEFLAVEKIALCAVFYSFFRALMLPVAYTALAKGKSMVYLTMEIAYSVVSCFIVWLGWMLWGLAGLGIALSLSALFDMAMILCCYGRLYGCRLQRGTVAGAAVQFVWLAVALAACLQPLLWVRFAVCVPVLCLSVWKSVSMFTSYRRIQ